MCGFESDREYSETERKMVILLLLRKTPFFAYFVSHFAGIAQLARAPSFQVGGCRFETVYPLQNKVVLFDFCVIIIPSNQNDEKG